MIVTPRLLLRPFRVSDLDALLAYRRDPDVARYQSWSETFSETDARDFITAVTAMPFGTRGAWGNLAIELSEGSDAIIGDVALRVEPDGLSAQIGFTVARAHQRHGYAREAVVALCTHVLRAMNITELFAITDARNSASIHLLERIDFRHVGFHAQQTPFKGELCDELRFERTR